MPKPVGIILWEGKSAFDGKPIVAIATGIGHKSSNPKTGPMISTWILRRDIDPIQAQMKEKDVSVCGNCKHRTWKTCYVNLLSGGPCGVYKAYKGGSYVPLSVANMRYFKDRQIRLGSYGEPTAVPFEVWDNIISVGNGSNGYTHQWRTCDRRFREVCMASVDTLKEKRRAKSKGWRTFRIILPEDALQADEYNCPASPEGGAKIQCDKCLACAGRSAKQKKSPVIIAHGCGWKVKRYAAIMKKRRNKEKYTHLIGK